MKSVGVPISGWGTGWGTGPQMVPNCESFSRVTIASSQFRAYFAPSG